MNNVNFYISMKVGYIEMGNINLQIANEHIQIDTDIDGGVNVYEMDCKETEGHYK